jgi:hypothetical protein
MHGCQALRAVRGRLHAGGLACGMRSERRGDTQTRDRMVARVKVIGLTWRFFRLAASSMPGRPTAEKIQHPDFC